MEMGWWGWGVGNGVVGRLGEDLGVFCFPTSCIYAMWIGIVHAKLFQILHFLSIIVVLLHFSLCMK